LAIEILAQDSIRKATFSGKASNAVIPDRLLETIGKLVDGGGIRLGFIEGWIDHGNYTIYLIN
jgi:hypothetical protein